MLISVDTVHGKVFKLTGKQGLYGKGLIFCDKLKIEF
jgi:hypothetical protein